MSYAILSAVTMIGLGTWLWGPDTRDGRDWARRGTGAGLGFGPGSRLARRDEFGLPGDFDGREGHGGSGRDGGPGSGGTPGTGDAPTVGRLDDRRPEPAAIGAFRPGATAASIHTNAPSAPAGR